MTAKRIIPAAAALTALAILWTVRAQRTSHPDLTGVWELVSASGTTTPPGFVMRATQSDGSLRVASEWTPPEDGKYGLTLIGVTVPQAAFSFNGSEDVNQAGPFVVHSNTRWEGPRLVTAWNTSEFRGTSFKGTWTRSLSEDGRTLTLQISADSSEGKHSEAVLKFSKR